MSIDLKYLAKKLNSYRNQFKLSFEELSNKTGISEENLIEFERGTKEPSGDEILILADYYKCDYKYFISNEKLEPLDETEKLYRTYDDEFSLEDRWSIQELLYLAECESYLQKELGKNVYQHFDFTPKGTFYKQHAKEAAEKLRKLFNYKENAIPLDVFSDFRSLGIHIFRRRLENSKISGLFVNHPSAGKCILINYSEDIFRQRYSVCHEVAHSIFDTKDEIVVSFTKWSLDDLIEIRAENFASFFLLPPHLLKKISAMNLNSEQEVISLSTKLKVSTSALAYALSKNKMINNDLMLFIKSVRVPRNEKIDPELSQNLSPKGFDRKRYLLEKGLSTYYVNLCFEAYNSGIISAARIAEMLMISENELLEISKLFMIEIQYGS